MRNHDRSSGSSAQRRPSLRRPSGGRLSEGGFSLVEVMIVSMIMGMMFVSISKLMTVARQTRDTIHNYQETQLAGPAILEMIVSDINGIFTLNRERAFWLDITDRTVNGQDADRIDFITTSDSLVALPDGVDDDEPSISDVNEVGYVLRPSEENDEFLEMFRREDFGIDEEPMRGGQYTFLSDRVKGFSIEVFAEDGPDSDPVDEWGASANDPELTGLPAFIRMTLTIELNPRIDRESLNFTGSDRRTIDYVRIIRFPERLRFEEGSIPRLAIPTAPGGSATDPGGGAGGATDGVGGGAGGPPIQGGVTATGGAGGGVSGVGGKGDR